jgi:hypothetical protein
MIPHPKPPKEAGRRDHLVGGRRNEGMGGLSIATIRIAMISWDVKFRIVGLGRKICRHV